MKAIVLLANGFEEVEGIAQINYLRRAGIEVTSASIHEDKRIIGQSMIAVEADEILTKINISEYDLVVLPGGLKGMENLRENKQVMELIKTYDEEKKWIAAICAAPSILGELGILNNRNCICYPGFENRLQGGKIVNEKVVSEGQFALFKKGNYIMNQILTKDKYESLLIFLSDEILRKITSPSITITNGEKDFYQENMVPFMQKEVQFIMDILSSEEPYEDILELKIL